MVQFGWRGQVAPDRYRVRERIATAPIHASSAREALAQVLGAAGASRPRRDAIDERIVRDVTNRTGQIIDSPADVGGYPQYSGGEPAPDADGDGMSDGWERENGLHPGDPADGNADRDGDGYTNVEEYLHVLMRAPSRRSGAD
jgi:hypothetical protein